jgi:RNA binding exosome subunit
LKGPIQSVEISYLVHATEDPAKVGGAVQGILGISSPPVTQILEGHFGNKIIHAKHHLTGDAASSALSNLANAMSIEAKDELLGDLDQMIDDHEALYIRLDKQSFLTGKLALAKEDPVRVRVKPRLFLMRGEAREFFRNALGACK